MKKTYKIELSDEHLSFIVCMLCDMGKNELEAGELPLLIHAILGKLEEQAAAQGNQKAISSLNDQKQKFGGLTGQQAIQKILSIKN